MISLQYHSTPFVYWKKQYTQSELWVPSLWLMMHLYTYDAFVRLTNHNVKTFPNLCARDSRTCALRIFKFKRHQQIMQTFFFFWHVQVSLRGVKSFEFFNWQFVWWSLVFTTFTVSLPFTELQINVFVWYPFCFRTQWFSVDYVCSHSVVKMLWTYKAWPSDCPKQYSSFSAWRVAWHIGLISFVFTFINNKKLANQIATLLPIVVKIITVTA